MPRNRIRAWVDVTGDAVEARRFDAGAAPRWPGWVDAAAHQWHGTMTSVAAAGNGWLSQGLYRGLAADSDVVLIQVRDAAGGITNDNITRALRWVREHGRDLGVRVVSVSVAGDAAPAGAAHAVDAAADALNAHGVVVVAAAGNNGERRLLPPATVPSVITVGGIDDANTLDHRAAMLWHSNYGRATNGARKPELVAPSIWVVAPVLPRSAVAEEARELFARRAAGDVGVEARIQALKLVTPHYQHVDGTSFAAPLVASAVACAFEANPGLSPALIRYVLVSTAHPVPGASAERQGAGALNAGPALARVLRERHSALAGRGLGPHLAGERVSFLYHDHDVRQVHVLGSWDGWRPPGLAGALVEAGLWRIDGPAPPPGRYEYKLLLDGLRWLDDPGNPRKTPDGLGGLNSVLNVPAGLAPAPSGGS
jgi:serine protease AprX